MKIKKLAIFLLIGILFLNQGIPVFAEMSPSMSRDIVDLEVPISPQWTNINNMRLKLDFSNGKAECSALINGLSGTSNIMATFRLERKGLFGWSLVNSWNRTSRGGTLSFFEVVNVSKGTYRLSVTAQVTRNGITETVNTLVEERH